MAKRALGAEINAYLLTRGWSRIDRAEWEELRARFAPTTESTLQKHVLASGVEITQPWRGLNTSTLDGLEQTLLGMVAAYLVHPREARRAVIAAKDRARFAARNLKAAAYKRELKAEMVEWMLVWLGDPAMFEDWAKLRKAYLARNAPPLVDGNGLDL